MEPLFIVLIIAVVLAAIILGYMADRKRREAIKAVAARLGLKFQPGKNRSIPRHYKFIDKIRSGRDRYAYNMLWGSYEGNGVRVFDYHYKTGSGKNTRHHYICFFILDLPVSVPELTVGPEGFLSKIAQAVGYDDIDFESHEFSRKFCVRSKDKKFAYDICHGQMIEYLLANSDMTIEMELHTLAVSFSRKMDPEKIEHNLKRLAAVRRMIPDYVIARS